MTVSGDATGAVVVERSGTCVSIRDASAGPEIDAALSPEPGRTAVRVDGATAAAALDALDRRLLADLYGHLQVAAGETRGGVRLLFGGAARSGSNGSPPLAARLADALGLEVVAPDGPLVVLRRGELFAAGPASAWWEFAPGGFAAPVGSRFPAPAWQRDLPARLCWQSPSTDVTVTPIPSGIWVRAAGGQVADLSDAAFAVPPAAERVVVLAGRPGEPRPPVDALAEVIAALPRRLRQRYVLVPYGPEPAGEAPIAQRLADEWGAEVRTTHGLPSYAPDGSLVFPMVDGAGRSTWRPFVIESACRPRGRAPTRCTWSAPLAYLPEAGPAAFWLADGWVVEVVPCGLQVRPASAETDPLVLRRPVDAEHVDLVVAGAVDVPVSVLGGIGRLARALPPDARNRLRMLVTDAVDPAELVGLAGALRLPIHRLTPAGRTEPVRTAAPALPDRPLAPSGPIPPAGPVVRIAPPAPGAPVPPGDLSPPAAPIAPVAPVAPRAPGGPAALVAPATAPVAPGAPIPPAGPGHLPAPLPPAAAVPVSAGAAPPLLPSPAEQPPHSPPDRRPRPAAVPAASLAAVRLVSLTPDRAAGIDQWWRQAGTVVDRRQLRLSLGWRYDAASRFVTSLLAERPGLRAVAAGDDGLAMDLAAVHLFAAADHAERLESLRAGAPDRADLPFVACVLSGLRRLPTFTGVVVRGGPDDPAAVDAYVGGDVVEPGLLPAVADLEAEVPGSTEVLIWSSTARRVDGLVDGTGVARVVFLPGTVFRVLDVDRTNTPRRVLLAEVPEPWRGRLDTERDERVRTRLRAAARSRAASDVDGAGADAPAEVGNAPAPAPAGAGLAFLPGLVPAEYLRGAA